MPPLTIMVKPASGQCNMRCAYCFYADVSERRSVRSYGRMTEETLETLVRRAFAYADGGVSFAFQGGEPTLMGADFYRALLSLQRKYNTRRVAVQNVVQTNGCDVPQDMIRLFAENDFLVGVSVDGARETHDALRKDASGKGTFDRAMRTVSALEEAGAQFNILTVVNGMVARAPEETFDALRQYQFLQFIPCLDGFDGEKRAYSLSVSDYAAFLKRVFDLYYAAFRRGEYVSVRNFDNYVGMMMGQPPENCAMRGTCGVYYLVEGDGSVYPCDFYVLDEWRMGNIRQDSFARLAQSPVAQKFRDMSRPVNEKCRACSWYALCRGGCRRDREPFAEGVPSLNRFCEAYRAFFDYAAPRMEDMARALARMENGRIRR